MLEIADPGSERGRICAGMLDLVARLGYPGLTLPDLERASGVGEDAFHRHFADLDECFAAIWTAFDREVVRISATAFAADPSWPGGVRAAMGEVLAFFAAEPAAARLYVAESVFADADVPARRRAAMTRLARLIDTAPGSAGDGGDLRPVSEAVAGAIWQRLHGLIRAGRTAELPAELPHLAYLCVLPFAGQAAAEAQLRDQPPPSP